MFGGRVPPGREEVGETVASFSTYEQAQKSVSTLIAGEIPARDIAIVGQGLRSVERVTGRLGYATAARSGAINGLFLGLLFSFIFVLGMPTVQVSVFLGVLLVGVAIGMLMSLITYAIVRRRRDFASVMQVVADHYEVCVLPTSLARARTVLGPATVVAKPVTEEAAAVEDAPPRYGERVAPAHAPSDRPDSPSASASPEAREQPAAPEKPAAPETSEPPASADRA